MADVFVETGGVVFAFCNIKTLRKRKNRLGLNGLASLFSTPMIPFRKRM